MRTSSICLVDCIVVPDLSAVDAIAISAYRQSLMEVDGCMEIVGKSTRRW